MESPQLRVPDPGVDRVGQLLQIPALRLRQPLYFHLGGEGGADRFDPPDLLLVAGRRQDPLQRLCELRQRRQLRSARKTSLAFVLS